MIPMLDGSSGLGRWLSATVERYKWLDFAIRWTGSLFTGIKNDQCLLRASALTYVTALSIVPFLAVAFSISKGFGFQNTAYIREFLLRITAGREVVVENIIGYINRTNVGTLGAVGVIGLFLTVISLLGSIEKSFNTVWGVNQSRAMGRKFADYLSITLICPLLIIVSISSTASMQSSTMVQTILSYSVFSYAYLVFLKVLPFLMIWAALFFIYKLVPNTRVHFLSALGGGFVGGLLWTVTERVFINYQVGLAKYNAIYGSFAQLPLFLLWLYISWVIVLFGAEVSYAIQNWETATREVAIDEYDFAFKQKLAIVVLVLLTRRFMDSSGPVSSNRMAEKVAVPTKLVNHVCHILSRLKFIVHSCQDDQEGYVLSSPPESFTLMDVIKRFSEYRVKKSGIRIADTYSFVHPAYEAVYEAAANDSDNQNLRDFTQQVLPP